MAGQTVSESEAPGTAQPPRYGIEVIAVLGVSLGMSAVYALLYYIRQELTVKGGIAATTATIVSGPKVAPRRWSTPRQLSRMVRRSIMPPFDGSRPK